MNYYYTLYHCKITWHHLPIGSFLSSWSRCRLEICLHFSSTEDVCAPRWSRCFKMECTFQHQLRRFPFSCPRTLSPRVLCPRNSAPVTTCPRASCPSTSGPSDLVPQSVVPQKFCPSDHQPQNLLPQYLGPQWPPAPERSAPEILPQWPFAPVPIRTKWHLASERFTVCKYLVNRSTRTDFLKYLVT